MLPNNAILPGHSSFFRHPIGWASGFSGGYWFLMYFVLLALQGLVAGFGGAAPVGIAGGWPPQPDDFFFLFWVPGHSFFQAIFKASNTQHNKASNTQFNLNEHTLKGGGKSTDTHKIKGLKLSAAKKCTKGNVYFWQLAGIPRCHTVDGMGCGICHI